MRSAVLRAWGFHYASTLVWTKAAGAYGKYWRHAGDLLLLGVRGQLPLKDNDKAGWIDGKKASPSDRCQEIRRLLECVSPPDYLDLFGKEPAEGWTVAST